MKDDKKKVALVTGGSSVGKTLAKILSTQGYKIVQADSEEAQGLKSDKMIFDGLVEYGKPKNRSKGKGKRKKQKWDSPYGP